jgi:hypothetical protein
VRRKNLEPVRVAAGICDPSPVQVPLRRTNTRPATSADLAFCQGEARDLRLGEEFHHNGLTIRCAQIGRVPRGLAATWDRRRLASETARLLRVRGDDLRTHLLTDIVPLAEAPAALLALARRERSTTQMVLDFGTLDAHG